MKKNIIGILHAKTKRAKIIDGGYYAEVIAENDFEVIAENIVKSCNMPVFNTRTCIVTVKCEGDTTDWKITAKMS